MTHILCSHSQLLSLPLPLHDTEYNTKDHCQDYYGTNENHTANHSPNDGWERAATTITLSC